MPHPSGFILLAVEGARIPDLIVAPLRNLGYQVVRARDAQIAGSLADSLDTLALVICDASSPGIDGPALIARLRQRRPDLPAIYVAEDRVLEGSDEVITEPFSAAEIVQRVLDLAGRHHAMAERAAVLRERLVARLRTPMLRDAYDAWLEAGGGQRLPRTSTLGEALAKHAEHVVVASVKGDERGEVTVRFLALGAALSGALGASLVGNAVTSSEEDLVGTLNDAYRRAVRTHLPSYEYARYRFGQRTPVMIERLLLPASSDGHTVTHLFGVVSIGGSDGASASMES